MIEDKQTTARSLAADGPSDTVPVPENPTKAELKRSLKDADFPRASHMAKEIFGENPKFTDEEE